MLSKCSTKNDCSYCGWNRDQLFHSMHQHMNTFSIAFPSPPPPPSSSLFVSHFVNMFVRLTRKQFVRCDISTIPNEITSWCVLIERAQFYANSIQFSDSGSNEREFSLCKQSIQSKWTRCWKIFFEKTSIGFVRNDQYIYWIV